MNCEYMWLWILYSFVFREYSNSWQFAMKVVNLRPSPNEEARLLKEERDRKRKLRIKQVFIIVTNLW